MLGEAASEEAVQSKLDTEQVSENPPNNKFRAKVISFHPVRSK